MAFLKPQSPLTKGNDYFYPLTTSDQVIMSNGQRLEDVVGKTVTTTLILYANGWSESNAPYTYTTSIPNLDNKTQLKIYPSFPDGFEEKVAYKKECAKICHCEREDSILIFECWEDVPTVDITLIAEMNIPYPLEVEIANDLQSSIPKLNFSIVGSTIKPTLPTENMIWVNTNIEIKNTYIGKAAPTSKLTYGDVWISTRDNGKVVFDMYKTNKIYTNPVSPIQAQQYINSIWQPVPAIIYQNRQWREWAKIPKEYQEVEFIQTSGTQCIDTGIIPKDNTYQVNTKIEVVTTTQNISIFGTSLGSTYYMVTPYSSKWYYGTNGTEKNGGVYSATVGKQYTITYNDKNHSFMTNNSIIATGLTCTATEPIGINSRGTSNIGSFKYFYFQIINNATDEIIMDLVPCYRKSDRMAGMYDTISGEFFTNVGTGEFIVGGDVI